jgi:hypothetical protein
VGFNERPRDCEAKTPTTSGLPLVQHLKDASSFVSPNSGSAIGYRDFNQPSTSHSRVDRHGGVFWRVADRVVDQVNQNLADEYLIDANWRQVV